MVELLHTIALNNTNGITLVEDAVKGEEYHCPNCLGDMIFRNSGKTGKGSKRPHFAHKSNNSNCSPESALHEAFKKKLFTYLNNHKKQDDLVPIEWECRICGYDHSHENLLGKTSHIQLEKNVGPTRPDISLVDENGKTLLAIEVVVTHKPETSTLEYFHEQGIHLVQYNLDENSLRDFNLKVKKPDIVDVCVGPKCHQCNDSMRKYSLIFDDGECYKCKNKYLVAWCTGDNIGNGQGFLNPQEFPKEAIQIAEERGVLFKVLNSKAVGRKYLTNACNKCKAPMGDFYLFRNHIQCNKGKSEIDMGYYCQSCNPTEYEKGSSQYYKEQNEANKTDFKLKKSYLKGRNGYEMIFCPKKNYEGSVRGSKTVTTCKNCEYYCGTRWSKDYYPENGYGTNNKKMREIKCSYH